MGRYCGCIADGCMQEGTELLRRWSDTLVEPALINCIVDEVA